MEVHSHPLARTFTPPVTSSHTRLHDSTSSTNHKSSSYSAFASRTSNPAQHTAPASTLWSANPNPTTAPHISQPSSHHVGASNNVINKVGEKKESLFQICTTLINRLSQIPGFDEDLQESQSEDEDIDPVSLLWRTFRHGHPLLRIYNTLRPLAPLSVPGDKFHNDTKRGKAAAFKFAQAVVERLNFGKDGGFIMQDLFSEDTSGFVKVARVVSRVCDLLEREGLIAPCQDVPEQNLSSTAIKRTQRQHIVDELVRTERTYVQHLEALHEFKRYVEQRSIIAGDAVHDIFLNLNALLDFQRRFLIRVEQNNALAEKAQDWGDSFIFFGSAWKVYESYIANQKTCEEAAMKNYEKLRDAGGPPEIRQIVESPTHLTAFLLKPFQRLSKYPLLLKELRDKGDLDEVRKASLTEAIRIITSVLKDTNAFLAAQDRIQAVRELLDAVEDWKNHQYDGFGELLLYGPFLIQKGDLQQSEREYKLYLFENMLLCCKDVTTKRNKLMPGNNKPQAVNPQRTGKPKYTLKGRIYLFNLEDVITMVKPGESYTCKLSWLANPGVEALTVRFPTEDIMNLWRDTLLDRKRACKQDQRRMEQYRQTQQDRLRARNSSEFNYLAEQGELENPYKQNQDDDLDDKESMSRFGSKESLSHSISNQGSSNSLRSRSTTGESGPPIGLGPGGRMPPMKYPAGFAAPLTLRTQQLQGVGASPMDRGGNSYFSPTAESPMSSRTSSSSGMMPFPRQSTGQSPWSGEESNRFTAPAPITRPANKEGQNVYYAGDARSNGRGPPAGALPMHPSSLAQTRLRSASSPDVQMQHPLNRQVANAPPVPSVPSHLAGQQQQQQQHPAMRSSNSGSMYGNGVPFKQSGQSPKAKTRQTSQLREFTSADGQPDYDAAYETGSQTSAQSQWSARPHSPPLTAIGPAYSSGMPNPFSFKIKVRVPTESTTFILVVSSNIAFAVLRDRIDAKLSRCTNLSMSTGNLRLQFKDDGEMISIQTDEDVQTAFDLWRESQHRDSVLSGQHGEIEIFCNPC